jgi:hypothetical protein
VRSQTDPDPTMLFGLLTRGAVTTASAVMKERGSPWCRDRSSRHGKSGIAERAVAGLRSGDSRAPGQPPAGTADTRREPVFPAAARRGTQARLWQGSETASAIGFGSRQPPLRRGFDDGCRAHVNRYLLSVVEVSLPFRTSAFPYPADPGHLPMSAAVYRPHVIPVADSRNPTARGGAQPEESESHGATDVRLARRLSPIVMPQWIPRHGDPGGE